MTNPVVRGLIKSSIEGAGPWCHSASRFTKGQAKHDHVKCEFVPKALWKYGLERAAALRDSEQISEEEYHKLVAHCHSKLGGETEATSSTITTLTSTEDKIRQDRFNASSAKLAQERTAPFTKTPVAESTREYNASFSLQPTSVDYGVGRSFGGSYIATHLIPTAHYVGAPVVSGFVPYFASNWIHDAWNRFPGLPGWGNAHAPALSLQSYSYPPAYPRLPYPPYPLPQSYPRFPHYPIPAPYPWPLPHPSIPVPQQPYPWPMPQPQNPAPIPVPQPQGPASQVDKLPTPIPAERITKPKIRIFDCVGGTNKNNAQEIDITNPPAELVQQVQHILETQTALHTMLADTYGINSWDNKGGEYHNYIRFDKNMLNAFWDGQEMIYGAPKQAGDDGRPADMTEDDVQAHELHHSLNSLHYKNDSGAIEEHNADVGSFITMHRKAKIRKPIDAPETAWMLGNGIIKDLETMVQCIRRADKPGFASKFDIQELGNINGKPHINAVRANANNQNAQGDNGGVHIFSGLGTYVFYLTAIAFDEPIYYDAETSSGGRLAKLWYITKGSAKLSRDTTWESYANTLVAIAREVGYNDIADKLVQNWKIVGITIQEQARLQAESAWQEPTWSEPTWSEPTRLQAAQQAPYVYRRHVSSPGNWMRV